MDNPFSFWFDGIFLCTLSSFGILRNLFSINILWQAKAIIGNMFHQLLIGLFFSDSLVLFTSILWHLKWNIGLKSHALTVMYPYIILPFNHIAMTASIFVTVGIAHERYQTTRKHTLVTQGQLSQQQHDLTTATQHHQRKLLKYLLPIFLFSVIFNIPKFLELKVVYAPTKMHDYILEQKTGIPVSGTSFIEDFQHSTTTDAGNFPNWNKQAVSVPELYVSDYVIQDPQFVVNYYWTCVVILGILPFALLAFLNYRIYKITKVQTSDEAQATEGDQSSVIKELLELTERLTEHSINNDQNNNIKKMEANSTKVAMAIVVVFLCCHGIRTLVQIILGACEATTQCGGSDEWQPIVLSFSNVFVILKSSVNMVICGASSKIFRTTCSETLQHWLTSIASCKQVCWRQNQEHGDVA